MDGRRFSQALNDGFISWLASPEAVMLHRSLQESFKILVGFTSLQEAVAFLHDGTNGDYQTKDALLLTFVEAYQAEGVPHRLGHLLLGALQPGLKRLFHRHAGRWPRLEYAELWTQITVSFLEVASSYSIRRRPHRVAKNLLMDTLRRTLRWLQVHHGPQRTSPRRRAEESASIEAIDAMRFAQALVRLGIVSGVDAAILLATRVAESPLPVLARQRGASYETVRKRRQRAESTIRRHLQSLAQRIASRDGVAPGSISLAEALEEMMRDVPRACGG